jgi:hypothetical protein
MMKHPKLTDYSDEGCRFVEWYWLKIHRFEKRDDLIEEAYPDADHQAWLNGLANSPHKDALNTYLNNIIRDDLITLEQVRQKLRVIAGDAGSDPCNQVAGIFADIVDGFLDNDPVVEPESVAVAEPNPKPTSDAGEKSIPSKPLNPTLIKREQKRIAAEEWSRNQYGEGFIENKAFISKAKKMVTDMALAGASRDEAIAATDTLIATYEQDYGAEPLTQAQQDSLRDNVVLKRYDRLYKADMIEQALLDGTTGAKRQVEIKAFALWHQIKRVAEIGDTPEIGQNTALRWFGGSNGTYMEPIELLIKLEAIEEHQPGIKQKSNNPNSPGQAAKYKRLV